MKRTAIRRTGRLRAQSAKVQAGAEAFKAVYKEVDARSGGRCEYRARIAGELEATAGRPFDFLRCRLAAREHHHTVKPRRSYHTAAHVIHLCKGHHSRVDWPYRHGKLVIRPVTGGFECRIVWAADKFAARSRDGMDT